MLSAAMLRLGTPGSAIACLVGNSLPGSSYGLLHKARHGDSDFYVSGPATSTGRKLAAELEGCAAHGISDEDAVAFVTNKTLSVGMGIVNVLTAASRAGGQGGTWYEKTLANLLVEYCAEAQQSVHNRYVSSGNATAAKDEYGACVQTLDGDQDLYAAGQCERVANCYWEEPREGQARSRRYTDSQYAANERAARDYMQSVMVQYGTLGFVLATAVFVGIVKFSISRGIYNKCLCDGDLQRNRVGYTAKEQKTPAVVYLIGLAIAAAAGLLGLEGDINLTTGLDAMFAAVDGAADGIQGLVSSVSSPLNSFVHSINASTEEVQLLLSSTDTWVGGLENGMRLRLDAFNDAHRHRFQGRDAEFDVLAAEVEDASADFISDIVDKLSAAMEVLQHDFLEATEIMEGQSRNVLAALTVVNGSVADTSDRLAYFRRMFDDYVGVRTTGVQALVILVIVAGVVGVLGVAAGLAAKKSCAPWVNVLRLTCIVTFTTTWVAFIVSSLLIVSAVSWSDGCHFLELVAARGWETAGLDGQSAAVLDGCLRGNSIAEEFNLTDALGFFEVYGVTAQEVDALNATSATSDVETAVFAVSDFVDSLNSTAVAVSHLDFYTNPEVNGSLLLDPNCPYNVTFDGEATAYLGRPWLALPTVEVASADSYQGNASDATNQTESVRTTWEAGGNRQSFARQGDESAWAYMSRIFNSSDCSSLNDDLLSAWDLAARERAMRDQMKEDLTCVATATSGDDGTGAESSVTECSGGNASSLSSSSSSSSTYSLSYCSCTSENYTASDTLLAYFRSFVDNVTDLRTDLGGLLIPSVAAARGLGALANASTDALGARCASRCSFLSSHYDNFSGAMCGTALSGLAQLGFSTFLMAFGGLALAVTSGVMVHRLKAEWASNMAKVLSTEEGIVMEEY